MGQCRLFAMYYAVCKTVLKLFTSVFHFKFVPHTTTIDYLNFIVRMLTYFQHLHMSYYYEYNTVQYF